MKAEAMSITFLAMEQIVKIPFFQRGYIWDKTNWEDMLRDLFDEQKSHFLGSLILKQQERQTGKPKEVLVIDGQQRLTTLSVLLKTLYDSFPEEKKKNCKDIISNHLFYKKNPMDSDYYIKIKHSKIDSEYYHKVIGSSINGVISKIDDSYYENINNSSHKILQCYKYFFEELKKKSTDDKVNLFNRLLNNDTKILVLIDLNEREDEQTIFDTINSAGVRLSGADIIKNALFQKAFEVFPNQDDVISLYNSYWGDIFIKDERSIDFWSKEKLTGRLWRDNIEILFHSIAIIKDFFDPDKNTLSDLSLLYKNYVKKLDRTSLEAFIKEIKEYAELYYENILVFEKSSIFSYSDDIQRLFHILDECAISTFHPYILNLFYKHKGNYNNLKGYLLKLERYIVRRMIAKKDTKSYNKICKEFIENVNSVTLKVNDTSDEEVLSGIKNISNRNAALLLFWIELFRRHNDTRQSVKELKYNYSLEHILPQKWEEHWSNVPVKNQNGQIITNEDAKKERNAKCYWIGNMTLLNSSLNTSLRNYSFEKKINGDGRKKGIKSYADLLVTKDDIVSVFENGDKIWDEEKIFNRTNKIYNELLLMW